MLDYWTPYVFCYSDTVVGYLLVCSILFFYQKIWWIISGITWKSGDLYLTFLLLFGLNAELFMHYTFSQLSQQNQPLCTFTIEPRQEQGHAMPSLQAQLTFSISSFLVLHMFLMQRLTKMRATLIIVIFPIFTLFSIYITRNNTIAQLAAGAVFGCVNGTLRILLYHFYIKRPLAMLGHYAPFDLLIPSTPLTLTRYEDTDDQMARMLDGAVAFEEVLPVTDESDRIETLFHEFSDALVGTRKTMDPPTNV